jgi:hypothetical protein
MDLHTLDLKIACPICGARREQDCTGNRVGWDGRNVVCFARRVARLRALRDLQERPN